jgi:hypothetical protein
MTTQTISPVGLPSAMNDRLYNAFFAIEAGLMLAMMFAIILN